MNTNRFKVGKFYENISPAESVALRKSGTKYILVLHSRSCGHCIRFIPELQKLAKLFEAEGKNALVVGIESSNIPMKWYNSGKVQGFPTVFIHDGSGRLYEYKKQRDARILYSELF